MSFLQNVADFFSSNVPKLANYAREALSSGSFDGLGNIASSVISALTSGSTLVDISVPAPPSLSSQVRSFVSSAAQGLGQVFDEIRTNLGPAIDNVLMLATQKEDVTKAMTEVGTAYSQLSVANTLATAATAATTLSSILAPTDSSFISKIPKMATPASLDSSPMNMDCIAEKIKHGIQFLKSFTPKSAIGANGEVAISRLLPWIMNENQLAVEFVGSGSDTSYTGLTPTTNTEYSWTGAPGTTAIAVLPQTLAPTSTLFTATVNQTPGISDYPTFPPKQDVYNWNLELSLDVAFTPTGGSGTMANCGASPLTLGIYAGVPGQTKSLVGTQQFKYNSGDTGLHVLSQISIPLTNGAADVDFAISTTSISAGNLTLNVFVGRMRGLPAVTDAPVTEVDYLVLADSVPTRNQLNGSQRWIDMMGKIHAQYPGYYGDPNFCIDALWNARVAENKALFDELTSTLENWSDGVWGTTAGTKPGISDKYAAISAGLTLAKAANLSTHLYDIGPMAGLSIKQIESIYKYLIGDFSLLLSALATDDVLTTQLITDNSAV